MSNKYHTASGFIGGTSDQDIDAITGYSDGDVCFGFIEGKLYVHELDESSGEAESSPYVIAPDDVGGGDERWILKEFYLNSEQALKVITEDTTFYVSTTGDDDTGDGSSGSPWATPHKAFDYLADYWIPVDVAVTIQCGDGTYTFSEELNIKHPCGYQITLTSENLLERTMSSVQSSSGSQRAWSVVVNLNSVADIEVGDFAYFHLPSGGTLPAHFGGVWEITNVDSGNSRITVLCTSNYTSAPSGSVSSDDVYIFKTIFDGETNGVHVISATAIQNATISNLCLHGKTSTDYKYGLLLWDSHLQLAGVVGVSGGRRGVVVDGVSTLRFSTLAISNAYDNAGLVSGNRSNPLIFGNNLSCVGNCYTSADHGISLKGPGILAVSETINSSGNYRSGINAAAGAVVTANDIIASQNGKGINFGYGLEANDRAYIGYDSSLTTDNNHSGNTTPSVGSVGNQEGFISQF
jgi:hypothetical protein